VAPPPLATTLRRRNPLAPPLEKWEQSPRHPRFPVVRPFHPSLASRQACRIPTAAKSIQRRSLTSHPLQLSRRHPPVRLSFALVSPPPPPRQRDLVSSPKRRHPLPPLQITMNKVSISRTSLNPLPRLLLASPPELIIPQPLPKGTEEILPNQPPPRIEEIPPGRPPFGSLLFQIYSTGELSPPPSCTPPELDSAPPKFNSAEKGIRERPRQPIGGEVSV